MVMAIEQRNLLARRIQHAVPLVPRPYGALADDLGLSETAVIDQVQAWHAEGMLREISAVLEGGALGFDSALVAGQVPEARLAEVAAVINRHPMVTHNYLREHAYNLWFTIAVAPGTSLEATLALLARATRVPAYFPLRRTHTFKVGVNFDLVECRNATVASPLGGGVRVTVTPRDELLFRVLQTPLPPEREPFHALSRAAGVGADELLGFARGHLGGAVRRYVGTFHHRRLGVHGNGMAVWNVPEERLAALGEQLARVSEVSHCYARTAIPGFPYRLYSMLHGPDAASCERLAARLAVELQADDYLVLQSRVEFKKCRLRYFLPELGEWEAAQRAEIGAEAA